MKQRLLVLHICTMVFLVACGGNSISSIDACLNGNERQYEVSTNTCNFGSISTVDACSDSELNVTIKDIPETNSDINCTMQDNNNCYFEVIETSHNTTEYCALIELVAYNSIYCYYTNEEREDPNANAHCRIVFGPKFNNLY